MKKRIYVDNASLTPIDAAVLREIVKWSGAEFGNPSSIHTEGLKAKNGLDDAHKRVARVLSAHADEIIFTGSGTEANALAILGLAEAVVERGKKYEDLHLLVSSIEHVSVLEQVRVLSERGVVVEYIRVTEDGIVDLADISLKLRPNTFLVSVMYANNETGTIQPIREISKIIRSHFALFHVDACQAPLFLPLDCNRLQCDMLTLDGQKIYGPRGIGVLYKKRAVTLAPIIRGGGQEHGLRSGTENVPAIRGMALALENAHKGREVFSKKIGGLRALFLKKILSIIPRAVLNGSASDTLPNIVNISIPGIDAEFVVLQLDVAGIAISTKSSCLRDEEESYVLRAMGKSREIARTSLRFSFGRDTTKKDILHIAKTLQNAIEAIVYKK